MFEARLSYLRDWWRQHGDNRFDDPDDWINSLSNVELLEALDWMEDPS